MLQQPQKKQTLKYNALSDCTTGSAASSNKAHNDGDDDEGEDDEDDNVSSSDGPTSSPSPSSPATTSPSSPAAVIQGTKKSPHPNPFASIEPPPLSRHRCVTLPGGADMDTILNSDKGPSSYDDLISVSSGQSEHLNKLSQQSSRENASTKVHMSYF